jgi:hypothetical protein
MDVDSASGDVAVTVAEDGRPSSPGFHVDIDLARVREAVTAQRSLQEVVVRTGPSGTNLHPRIERLLLRCFDVPPYPLDDRDELIYPALFGFDESLTLWRSARSMLRVVRFQRASTALANPCVSTGLSEPWVWQPAEIYKCPVAGAGYELVVLNADQLLASEFSAWVRYVEESHAHILPGNWLEYDKGQSIPGTNVAGFLVVRPERVPESFPVGDSVAYWHELIPVGASALQKAKATDVFQVAAEVRRASIS